MNPAAGGFMLAVSAVGLFAVTELFAPLSELQLALLACAVGGLFMLGLFAPDPEGER